MSLTLACLFPPPHQPRSLLSMRTARHHQCQYRPRAACQLVWRIQRRDAVEQYTEGKLQPNPNNPSSVSASLSALLEDSILAHPSRWFTSHKQQQPYESTRGSPRGLFVTFTSGHGTSGGESDIDCVDGAEQGCDMTVDESFELLRRTAPEYMNFTRVVVLVRVECSSQRQRSALLVESTRVATAGRPGPQDLLLLRCRPRDGTWLHVQALPPSAATSTGSGGNAGTENSVVPHWAINSSHTDDKRNVRSGVKFTDGDGTVPLISLGFMCSAGWKGTPLNPATAAIITREYLEVNATMAILRAATSTDHVDIMGNSDVIADLLRVVGVRRKGTVSGGGQGRKEEIEKERARDERRRVLEAENEGRKKEEKGPKTEEQRRTENPPDERAQKGEPEPETKPGSESSQRSSNSPSAAADLNAEGAEGDEWIETYHEVKDRVLSCVREVSAVAERRLLQRLGVSEWKAIAKSTQTAQQSSIQDPYVEKVPEVTVQPTELRSEHKVAEQRSS